MRRNAGSDRTRRITVTYYAELVLGTTRDVSQQYLIPEFAEDHQTLLARNPYSDVAYRVLIETELAVGSEAAALAVYRRSVTALAELGLAPDQDMARLLQRSTA